MGIILPGRINDISIDIKETPVMTVPGDIDHWLEKAYTGELLPESAIRLICLKTMEVLSLESNVRSVSSPVVIVG